MAPDRRFGQELYRELFPAHWENPEISRRPEEIKQAVAAFWSCSTAKGS